jgi:hypothetical protein
MSVSSIGSVADIITAVTTIGALVAAVIAAKHAGKLFRVESGRDKHAAQREVQEQASKVYAWVATRIGDNESYGAVVVNSSEQAIYDVNVRVTDRTGTERPPISLTTLPPGAYYLAESRESYAWEFASRLRSFEDEIRPITKSRERGIVGMRFRDSANLIWERDATGRLVPTR